MKYVAVLLLVLLVRSGSIANHDLLHPKNLVFKGAVFGVLPMPVRCGYWKDAVACRQ